MHILHPHVPRPFRSNELSLRQFVLSSDFCNILCSSSLAIFQPLLDRLSNMNFMHQVIPCRVVRQLINQSMSFFFNDSGGHLFSPIELMLSGNYGPNAKVAIKSFGPITNPWHRYLGRTTLGVLRVRPTRAHYPASSKSSGSVSIRFLGRPDRPRATRRPNALATSS